MDKKKTWTRYCEDCKEWFKATGRYCSKCETCKSKNTEKRKQKTLFNVID